MNTQAQQQKELAKIMCNSTIKRLTDLKIEVATQWMPECNAIAQHAGLTGEQLQNKFLQIINAQIASTQEALTKASIP